MFNESKVTHMAAYLLKKAERNTLPHLKLMKLLYLAERTAYLEHDYGISDDTLVNPTIDIDALDELSQADKYILDKVWAQFKDFDQFDLSDYTQDPKNCPEWEDPNGSSYPIDLKKLFASQGCQAEQVAQLAQQVQTKRNLETLFSRY